MAQQILLEETASEKWQNIKLQATEISLFNVSMFWRILESQQVHLTSQNTA